MVMKQDYTHIVKDDPLPCIPMLYIMLPSYFNTSIKFVYILLVCSSTYAQMLNQMPYNTVDWLENRNICKIWLREWVLLQQLLAPSQELELGRTLRVRSSASACWLTELSED